jgi:hypothetical protein
MPEDAPKPESEDPPPRHSYPTECPACRQQTAKPKSAGTVKGQEFTIRLDMLCGHCAHEWTYDKLLPHTD